MRFGIALSIVALLASVVAVAATAAAGLQSPRGAEVNLLRAPRLLGRWDSSFTNPRTRLVLPTTVVRCRGLGTARAGLYAHLRCTIRSPSVRVTIAYQPIRRFGFVARVTAKQPARR